MNYLIATLVAVKAVKIQSNVLYPSCPESVLKDNNYGFIGDELPCHSEIKLGDKLAPYHLLGVESGLDFYKCGFEPCANCKVGEKTPIA